MKTATMTMLRRWWARHARNAGTAAALAALSAGALAGPIAFNRHTEPEPEPEPRVESPAPAAMPVVASPTRLATAATPAARPACCATLLPALRVRASGRR